MNCQELDGFYQPLVGQRQKIFINRLGWFPQSCSVFLGSLTDCGGLHLNQAGDKFVRVEGFNLVRSQQSLREILEIEGNDGLSARA